MMKTERALSPRREPFDFSSFFQNFGMLIVLIAICIVVSLLTDKFLTASNILSVARQVSINGILAIGVAFVVLTGGIDLSVGSLLALTATIATGFAQSGMNWILAMIMGVLTGMLVGLIEGLLIARLRIAPFITTLAAMTICRGVTQVYDKGTAIATPNEYFKQIGVGYIGVIPIPVVIMVLGFAIAWFVLIRTKFGRHVYAVGGNEQAAVLSGVSASKVKITVYIISGICCAISGYITAARLQSATPTAGQGAEMDAIAAVVLGGISLEGGKGSIIGVFIGAFIIGVLNNALNLMGVSTYWQDIAKGLVIVLAVVLDKVLAKGKS